MAAYPSITSFVLAVEAIPKITTVRPALVFSGRALRSGVSGHGGLFFREALHGGSIGRIVVVELCEATALV